MKFKFTKLVAMVLAGAMILSGCSSASSAGKATATPTPTPATSGTTNNSDTANATDTENEKIGVDQFTIYIEDVNELVQKEQFNSDVAKKIKADTGVTINSVYGVGDVTNQVMLMIANEEYPDMVYARSNHGAFVEAGAFIDLAPLIEEYGTNIKALYGDSLKAHQDEQGRIFFLGTDYINRADSDPRAGFLLQHAVVKEAGYPEIKTLDDYKKAIQEYIAKNPTIDDMPTIGMTLTTGDGWRWKISVGNPAGYATGCPEDGDYYINPETYEATYRFALDSHRAYFEWLNGMYLDGLLDRDAFTQTHEEYIAKIASGRVLGMSDAVWEYKEGEDILKNDGKYERTYGLYPATISPDVKYALYRQADYVPSKGIGVTTNCADPIAAIKFLDYWCKEETQTLVRWGLEGEHWEIRDGERVFTQKELEISRSDKAVDHTIESGIGLYGFPWPTVGTGVRDAQGYHMSPTDDQSVIDKYSDVAKETLAAYGKTMWRDFFPLSDEFEKSPWGEAWEIIDALPKDSELGMVNSRISEITASYLAQMVMAPEGKFASIYDEYQQKLTAAGVDKAGELLTEIIKDKAAWTER